jgi:hypothetical protein
MVVSRIVFGVLTVRWPEPKRISPSRSEIPSDLHLWTGRVTYTCVIRGNASRLISFSLDAKNLSLPRLA